MTEQADMFDVTLDEMIAEIDRELQFRAVAFPRMKRSAGLAEQNFIDRRMQILREVRAYLVQQRDKGETTTCPQSD